MNSKAILFFSLCSIAFLTCCTLESSFNFNEPDRVDNSLLGKWQTVPTSDEYIKFKKMNRHTYQVTIKTDLLDTITRGYCKKIKEASFINIVFKQNNNEYYQYFQYQVKEDSLHYIEIQDNESFNKIENEKQLNNILESKIKDIDDSKNKSSLIRSENK